MVRKKKQIEPERKRVEIPTTHEYLHIHGYEDGWQGKTLAKLADLKNKMIEEGWEHVTTQNILNANREPIGVDYLMKRKL